MSTRKPYYYARKYYKPYGRRITGYGSYKYTAAKPAARRAPAKPKAKSTRSFRGQESKYLSPAFSAVGGLIGGALGGAPGAAVGMGIGGTLGQGIKTLTGYGDYKVRSNTLVTGRPPSIANRTRGGGSILVSHKEYLGDITSSSSASTFKIQEFPIQPGSSLTFPWLSQIAANFQEYRFHGVIFHFRSMSADALNSTNTALGSVVMSTEYNAASPAFTSKAEMENAQFSNSIKPSESCLHLIECARASTVLTNLYVRTDSIDSATQDIRFYDLGNFFIASTGCQGTSVNLGELWVTYEIELFKPKLWSELGETIDYWNGYTLTGVANATPFGTADFIISDNSNVDIDVNPATRIITLPPTAAPKSYLLRIFWRGTRTASLDPPATTYTNASASDTVMPYQASPLAFAAAIAAPDTNAASSSLFLEDCIFFKTTGNGAIPSILFAATGTLPASAVLCSVILIQVPDTYAFNP